MKQFLPNYASNFNNLEKLCLEMGKILLFFFFYLLYIYKNFNILASAEAVEEIMDHKQENKVTSTSSEASGTKAKQTSQPQGNNNNNR